ncbi:hypothetical protein [Planctomicrobium piriforme]|uniref:Uncharacterized protein n=1 Tax=Planctomicrobium piriforme TaxID=1576369 RepID=A0A1I3GY99_9PLAN|nr:hypothetical protein [Planctomicrobium piriforme]SFI28505.1 hypothetical protein SAMN05421753_107180 [Planctomicrobium piriforme]
MASTKPTAVHFSLVIFVMSTLILALVCYLNYKEFTVAKLAAAAAADKSARSDADLRTALDEMTQIKRKLGYPDFEAIGTEADTSPNTVSGALNRDLALYGREQVQPSPANPSVAATLQSLRSALNAAEAHVRERQSELVNVQTELAQEQAAHTKKMSEIQTSQSSSEEQLQELVAQKNELVSEKDREIAKWRDEFRREQREKESLRDELDALRKQKETEIREFESVVGYLREKLNSLEDLSFDKADGQIVRVDNTTRAVWINLGSDDGLRSQVAFSVYTRNHNGFGRGNADIKAKIEVTKIRGPHLAEARILQEDLARPIQALDPIYSPAWSKGLKEYFSFVGVLDMNGDEKSDRELLHTVLQNSGAGVELEIDDAGNRVPEGGQLSVKSKFLIIGKIEDPADYPGSDTQKQEEVRKVIQEYTDLTKEAMRKGIKVVSFRDFLNYMGYEQQQRLFNTDSRGFNLKTGTEKTPVEDFDADNRLSVPNPSKRFKADGSLNKPLPKPQ